MNGQCNSGPTVSIEHIGPFRWEWSARGTLTRAMESTTAVYLPSGRAMQVGTGIAFTRRGALRKGRRLLDYYCATRRPEVVNV